MPELINEDETTIRIVVVSADLKAAKDVDAWYKLAVRELPENSSLKHFTVQENNIFKVPVLPKDSGWMAKSDLLIVAYGDSAASNLSNTLHQQAKDHSLTTVVLLPDELCLTSNDINIPSDLVSTIRTSLSVVSAVNQLLLPLIGGGLIKVSIDDFKLIVPAGSIGYLRSATDSNVGGAVRATEAALQQYQNSTQSVYTESAVLLNLATDLQTLTVGRYISASEALKEHIPAGATVICTTSVSESLPPDCFEATVITTEW